ncbi:MAG TPA: hypothetical protein VMU84_15395, partial [Thermoanaerobaculia bacterium]|nr:hypothetical protein [Thermoanaerobaculia bacterium]
SVIVTIDTDGPPVLLATPFATDLDHELPLTAGEQTNVQLVVANQGIDCETSENSYDFLLHFLTARTGIPRTLVKPTPGMNMPLPAATHVTFNAALARLSTIDYPNHFRGKCFATAKFLESPHQQVLVTSVACSDTRYP